MSAGAMGGWSLRVPGRLPAALVGLSVVLVAVVGFLGPSAIVLTLGADSPAAPPWHLLVHPSAWIVVPATVVALLAGGAGLVSGLQQIARGWVPRAGRWVFAGTVAALATVAVPPASTADPLIYAAYGRLVTLGANPYVITPRALILTGDPVGLSTEGPWQQVTSVYGPLATGEQALASWLGGASTALTIFWMQLANVLGWLVAGLLLLILVRHDRAARSRVVLLWWMNPVLLWGVLSGGHNDAIAAAFIVAALLLLGRHAFLSGLAVGAASTVKLLDAVVAIGLLWAVRRQPRAALALVGGAVLLAVVAYAPILPESLNQTRAAHGYLSSASPWRLVKNVVGTFATGGTANTVLSDLSWVVVVLLVGVLIANLPLSLLGRSGRQVGSGGQRVAVRPGAVLARLAGDGGRSVGAARTGEAAQAAFVVGLAWLLAGYYTLPWYDLVAWIPVCVLAGSALDLVLIIRTTVICIAYVATRSLPPGERVPGSLASITRWLQQDLSPFVHLVLIALVVVAATARGRAFLSRVRLQSLRSGRSQLSRPPARVRLPTSGG
jgi:alpha-1,6-mannosyltransferase